MNWENLKNSNCPECSQELKHKGKRYHCPGCSFVITDSRFNRAISGEALKAKIGTIKRIKKYYSKLDNGAKANQEERLLVLNRMLSKGQITQEYYNLKITTPEKKRLSRAKTMISVIL